MPIVQGLHWSLAVIANLDSVETLARDVVTRSVQTQSSDEAFEEGQGVDEDAFKLNGSRKRTRAEVEACPPPPLQPCVLFMDSLSPQHCPVTVAANLISYVREEWPARRALRNAKRSIPLTDSSDMDAALERAVDGILSGMQLVEPPVPRQRNSFDCGVFALQYAEKVIVRWPECRGYVEGFSVTMFTSNDIDRKRRALKDLAHNLSLPLAPHT